MRTKIEVNGIRKGFALNGGELRVVDDVSLTVGDGEFVAIVGPSGCGKTTLMNMVVGFVQPDSGSILIDGVPRAEPNAKGILISQQGSIFPWLTVQQNLMFGLNGFEGSYPHELSGGMLKRAELARAFAVKPEILYMDEPFSALDALTNLRMRNELLRILEEERHTVRLITHDVEEAIHLADRILVLSPRPTRIQAMFKVDIPHPRKLTSPEVQELRVAILQELCVDRNAG